MAELDYLGREARRPEAADKAAGRTEFIHDLRRPGMLHGKVKFSAHPHARISNIDTSRAERLPGVRLVLTGYNTPELRIGLLRDNFALKRDKVRQCRDEVAAVAAIDPDIAAEAVELIHVEYEPLPAVFDPSEALKEGAPLVHEHDAQGRPLSSNRLPLSYRHDSGGVAGARRASRHVVESEYTTQLVQPSCLETAGCVAEFDLSDNLTIWARSQAPFLAQRDFNRALTDMGLRGNARVIVPALGGGFGTGLDTHAYEYIAILLSHRSGRPVKIVYEREEELANLSPRQSCRARIAQGCDAEGKLTFRHIEVLLDNGAYTSWGAIAPTMMMLPATSLYRVPSIHFEATLAYTNNTYCQAMRGHGNAEITWAIESNLDELASVAGIDPLEIRLRNCNQPEETTAMGLKVTSCRLRECLERAAGKLDWSSLRVQAAGAPLRRGVGLASLVHVGGSSRALASDASGLILKLDDFGNVNVHHGGVEMGQGLHSVLRLAVAESLGVRPEQVFVEPTDTATSPWDAGTWASRGAFVACNAAILAAHKARRRIFELAAELYDAEVESNLRKHHGSVRVADFAPGTTRRPEDFELRGGYIFHRAAPPEPFYRVELGRLLRASHFRRGGELLVVEASYDPPTELPDWSQGLGNPSATYAWGAQAAEVEVDVETGEVRLLRLAAVHDVGKVLEPQALRGQIHGALAQGIGYALYEEIRHREGRILNPSFRDYKIPTVWEMGLPIDVELVESDDRYGPFGAKGAGEAGLVPTAPAIANAIYHAVGVRIRDLPLTPEKILAALAARESES